MTPADYKEIRELLISIMQDIPELSCEDFNHTKKDFHKGFDCPVAQRFYKNWNKLLRTFNLEL